MWPHLRVAWWDVKTWLAIRGRRIAAAVALTALAGGGLAASQYYASPPKTDMAGHDQPTPALDPTIPWTTPSPGQDPGVAAAPPITNPTFVSPTQPWPDTNP